MAPSESPKRTPPPKPNLPPPYVGESMLVVVIIESAPTPKSETLLAIAAGEANTQITVKTRALRSFIIFSKHSLALDELIPHSHTCLNYDPIRPNHKPAGRP